MNGKEQDNIFNSHLKKIDGKLVYPNSGQKELYQLFIDSLEEGQEVTIFMEANKDDGTNAQLALIHVCIRKIAVEMGYTFDELKTEIKKKAGLIQGKQVKSLGLCSKDELVLVIESIKEAGDMVNINCF